LKEAIEEIVRRRPARHRACWLACRARASRRHASGHGAHDAARLAPDVAVPPGMDRAREVTYG
ncbi:MAG: hypothetical protein ABSB75_00185, partial [Candidatus Limnocylindrales bacterium]